MNSIYGKKISMNIRDNRARYRCMCGQINLSVDEYRTYFMTNYAISRCPICSTNIRYVRTEEGMVG